MPITHASVVFDVNDAKVYPLLTDTAGASPTYGAGLDVPGIASVTVNPNIVSAELKGDARIIAVRGRTDRVSFSGTYGKLSGDVMGVILGSSTTDSGTTPNQLATFRLKSPAALPYFKIEFQIQDVEEGLGDLRVVLYKCKLTGGTLLGTSSDNFGQPTFDADAIAINGTLTNVNGVAGPDVGAIGDWILRETAVALP
jgi:hypothetical protein